MKNTTDARVIKSKNSLKESLLDLMKSKKFEKINVCEICEKSGVHRMTFYNHYADKYALFSDAINDIKETIQHRYNREILYSNNLSSTEQIISVFEVLSNELALYYPIFKSIIGSECYYELFNLIHKSFEEGLIDLSYRIFKDRNQYLDYKIKFFIGGIGHLLTYYMYNKDEINYQDFKECLRKIVDNFYNKN